MICTMWENEKQKKNFEFSFCQEPKKKVYNLLMKLESL